MKKWQVSDILYPALFGIGVLVFWQAVVKGSDGTLDVAAAERTVATLMKGGSDPVISKKPEGAWTSAVTDKAKGM